MPFDALVVSITVTIVFLGFASVLAWASHQTAIPNKKLQEPKTDSVPEPKIDSGAPSLLEAADWAKAALGLFLMFYWILHGPSKRIGGYYGWIAICVGGALLIGLQIFYMYLTFMTHRREAREWRETR